MIKFAVHEHQTPMDCQDSCTYTTTPSGLFRGIVRDGVREFRGITFARYSRLSESVMETPEGQVDATEYGCVPPQRSCRLESTIGKELGSRMEEGRLCLTVYSPENAEKLPVMVWIHGGSFLTGGSEEKRYSGRRLVKAGGVVVVKISYRLGALGFLYAPDKGAVNLGLKDQRLALEWIRLNISEFGGDPDNITIFGQSAGALSAAALVATAVTKLPFNKVILQSAPLGMRTSPAKAARMTEKFLSLLGKDPMEASLDEILDAQDQMKGMNLGVPFMPMVEDFLHVPECIRGCGLKAVAGWATEDASPFLKDILGRKLGSRFGRALVHRTTKRIFIKGTRRYIARLREAGLEACGYEICWHPKGNPLGACHCIEMPFILGERDDWAESGMLRGAEEDEYSRNEEDLTRIWTTFAKEGIFQHYGVIGE